MLDVLSADCKLLNNNRYVYVCLKEAEHKAVELPKHAQMLNRISSNKTIGRLYEGAIPIATCIRKLHGVSCRRAQILKVKPIKGLS